MELLIHLANEKIILLGTLSLETASVCLKRNYNERVMRKNALYERTV